MSNLDFNPNTPAKTKHYFWATFIPDRHPKFKMYSQRGHALASLQYRDKAIIFKWDQDKDEWVEKFRREKSPNPKDYCNGCDTYLVNTSPYSGQSYNIGNLYWRGDDDNLHQVTLCYKCKTKK
jgi:hypothetical protein